MAIMQDNPEPEKWRVPALTPNLVTLSIYILAGILVMLVQGLEIDTENIRNCKLPDTIDVDFGEYHDAISDPEKTSIVFRHPWKTGQTLFDLRALSNVSSKLTVTSVKVQELDASVSAYTVANDYVFTFEGSRKFPDRWKLAHVMKSANPQRRINFVWDHLMSSLYWRAGFFVAVVLDLWVWQDSIENLSEDLFQAASVQVPTKYAELSRVKGEILAYCGLFYFSVFIGQLSLVYCIVAFFEEEHSVQELVDLNAGCLKWMAGLQIIYHVYLLGAVNFIPYYFRRVQDSEIENSR